MEKGSEDVAVEVAWGAPWLALPSQEGQEVATHTAEHVSPITQMKPTPLMPALVPEGDERPAAALDLDMWRHDLQRLNGAMSEVVQTFIANQTRQLDTVAAELASQKERIVLKEQRFTELSDSIASFVEEETKRLEVWGVVPSGSEEADARHEAYDAELPGPPALHRINRLWRKATRAFEGMREAKEREAAAALEEQRQKHEALLAEAMQRSDERAAEVKDLEAALQSARAQGDSKASDAASAASALAQEVQSLKEQLETSQRALADMTTRFEQLEVARSRSEYEWGAEREELVRERAAAEEQVAKLQQEVAEGREREEALTHKCEDRADKLEQMRRLMDDQEREMTTKIERVQLYVKERQAGALHAEKKQQDAERMAERWQSEVRRLQSEKDKLAKLVLDLETHQSGQSEGVKSLRQQHQQEILALQEALRLKEEEMRDANSELMQQRDEEYQSKVNLERQREKDRSIALLRKKEQEVQIKDQQLKSARQRIQDLEMGGAVGSGPAAAGSGVQTPSPRGSSAGRRPLGTEGLPPLPLSAR